MYFPDSSKVSRPDTLWCLSRGFGCIRGNGEHNNTMLCKSENNSFVKLLNKPHPHVQRSGGPPTADVLLSTTVLFHMILKLLLPPFLSLPLWLMAVPFIFSMFHVLLHSLLHVLYVFPIISWRYCMRVLFASQTHTVWIVTIVDCPCWMLARTGAYKLIRWGPVAVGQIYLWNIGPRESVMHPLVWEHAHVSFPQEYHQHGTIDMIM